jgi:hypothetical protein
MESVNCTSSIETSGEIHFCGVFQVHRSIIEFRVARWYILIPKIPIFKDFGWPWSEKLLYVLWVFGIFYDHLEYFMIIWNIL